MKYLILLVLLCGCETGYEQYRRENPHRREIDRMDERVRKLERENFEQQEQLRLNRLERAREGK